jgi:hypothetical protein
MGRLAKVDHERIAQANEAYDRQKAGNGHTVTLALMARRYNLTEIQLVNFRHRLKKSEKRDRRKE